MSANRSVVTFVTIPARGHMPFKGHRTQRQVRLDEKAYERALEEA